METIQKSSGFKSFKSVYIIAILFVLLLDWAALHDIIKGDENTFAEYSMLAISLIAVPFLIFKIYKK